LQTVVKDIDDKKVALLLIVEGNPVYNAPVDLKFAERLQKVKFSAHLSLYNDETSQYCQWHVPAAHFLEAWTDLRTYDGTITIAQPLIYPLYDGKSAHEFITALTDKPDMTGYDLVRGYWQGQQLGGETFETVWRKALHDGTVANTKLEAKAVTVKTEALAEKGANSSSGLEITFRPDPTVFDGRFANNGWLQELPKPLTKLTWDNAVLINPKTATKLNIDGHRFGRHGGERGEAYADIVEVRFQGRSVTAPVWVTPGQPEDVITLHLGYGREYAGQVANKIGFNAYSVRSTTAMWAGNGVEIVKRDGSYGLACTQGHHLMEGRDIVRSGTLAEFLKNRSLAPEHGGGHGGETAAHASPDAGHGAGAANNREADHATDHNGEHKKRSLSMYPGFKYEGYAWGMTIDVNSCVGCNACVVACQAENNGPVVGKEQVMMARSMHWIRIDSYYRTVDEQSPTENPETYFQPVPCMQCENAPCEVVCPVGATVHSAEGLNDMVYNRCIGTRYCSNNCPYKVRRFNFLDYSDFRTPSLKLSRNPDVTVRSRGVMEKCTYCVQRINQARLEAEKENRPIRDGEIVTACQAVCPTEAIVFGDTNNAESLVAKLKKRERNYGLLDEEINTKPRTTYLGALRNPNPEMKKG
jgi:molybdopterin-containing oxidoreductase family iron-sulfur binding subunit